MDSAPVSADDLSRQYQEILNQYANDIGTSPPKNLPPTPEAPLPPPPPVVSSLPPVSVEPPKIDVFKYLFVFSFIVFLVVAGAVVYTFLQDQRSPSSNASASPPTPFPSPVASPSPSAFCELNDKKYKIGESFPAADKCNTCLCQPDMTIECTYKKCPSATPTIKS